jgi:hypothetical protein
MKTNPALLGQSLLLLVLPWLACAGPKAVAPAGKTLTAPAHATWPGQPDARAAKLVAAAGDDVLALAMISPDAWTGLRQLLGKIDTNGMLRRQLPMLESDDIWQPLGVALGLLPAASAAAPRPLPGWDRARPLALAFVDDDARGVLSSLCARLVDPDLPPVHLRILVPTSDEAALSRAFAEVFAEARANTILPGRYVLESRFGQRLAIAVVPAGDHLRLELLYLQPNDERLHNEAALRALLDRVAKPPRPRAVDPSSDAVARMLSSGHGLGASVRPDRLARWFLLDAPTKMRQALVDVPPEFRAQLQAKGTSEMLNGYLVTSAGEPEVAELGLALEIGSAIRAVVLAKLTETGKQQLSGLVNETGTAMATSPDALGSLAIAVSDRAGAKRGEPLFGPGLRMKDTDDLIRHAQEAGMAGFLAVLARPGGLLQTLLADEAIANGMNLRATLPADVAFDLFDFDRNDKVSFRLRGRLPKEVAAMPAWLQLLRAMASETRGGPGLNLEEEKRADGTWLSWTANMTGRPIGAAPAGRAELPAGTFCTARVRPAAIGERMGQASEVDYRNEEDWLLQQLLAQFVQVDARLRWHDGYLVAQTSAALAGQPAPAPFEPALPVEENRVVGPRPGKTSPALLRAVLGARDLSDALANVPPQDRLRILAHGRSELATDLDLARRDSATRDEAAALDRLLSRIGRAFEEAKQSPVGNPDERARELPDDSPYLKIPVPNQLKVAPAKKKPKR